MEGIKKAIDLDKESLLLIKYSKANEMRIKTKLSIIGKYEGFNDPSPCQYAILAKKYGSLKGLLHYCCDPVSDPPSNKDNNWINNCLGMDLMTIFFPRTSYTKKPLLHLAAHMKDERAITILCDYLNERGKLDEIINKPGFDKECVLSTAIQEEGVEVVNCLLRFGADPFFVHSEKKRMMPIILALRCSPYIAEVMVNFCKNDQEKNKEKNKKERLTIYFNFTKFNDRFLIAEEGEEETKSLIDLLEGKQDNRLILINSGLIIEEGQDPLKTANVHNQPSDAGTTESTHTQVRKCSEPGCDKNGNNECNSCQKFFCESHFDEHAMSCT